MSDFYIAVNADPLHADSIPINSGDPYFIVDGTLDLSTSGIVAFRQAVKGADANERIEHANALFRLLARAAQAESIGSAITFTMRRGGTEFAHFDLKPAAAETLRQFDLRSGGALAFYDLTLPCYDYPRGDAFPVTVSGTLAGSTAAFLVTDIPGHIDALAHLELTDTSGSGVINRARVSVIRGDFDAATDYTPWVDANAITPDASDVADVGNSYGDDYATRTLTSTSWADIARGVQPAGARQQGRMDGYARVYSTGTAIGAGANLDGTVNAPDAITSTAERYARITLGQTGSGRTALGTNPVATWGGTTTAGSLLLAIGYRQVSGASDNIPTASGVTWKRLTSVTLTSEFGNEMQAYVYYQRNAPAQSGNVTWDHDVAASGANPSAVQLLELLDADAVVGYEGATDTANADEYTGAVGTATSFANEYLLSLFFLPGSATADATDFWYAGYEPLFGGNEIVGGSQIIASSGTTTPTPKVRLSSSYQAMMNLNLHIKPVATESSVTTYTEPTPGELETGTYTARVQAEDAATYRGNASSSATDTVTTARSSIDYTCDVVSNADSYIWTIEYDGSFYEAKTLGPAYELTSLSGLKIVSGLPATSGASAPPPYIRARGGTANDHSLTKLKPDEIQLSGAGAFEIVRLFSNQMLPPIDAPLDDTWANWAVEIQGKSANGENATVRVDALWVVPCREHNLEAWIVGLAHGTKRRWILESHRSGKGVFGWLEDTSSGDEVGRLTTAGSLLIPPGTSIVLLEFEQAAGVHTFAAQVTATLTVHPRFRWEATL